MNFKHFALIMTAKNKIFFNPFGKNYSLQEANGDFSNNDDENNNNNDNSNKNNNAKNNENNKNSNSNNNNSNNNSNRNARNNTDYFNEGFVEDNQVLALKSLNHTTGPYQ